MFEGIFARFEYNYSPGELEQELKILGYREAVISGTHDEFVANMSLDECYDLNRGLLTLHTNTPKEFQNTPEEQLVKDYLWRVYGS